MIKITFNKFFYWLTLIICFVGIPFLMTFGGYKYFVKNQNKKSILANSEEIKKFYSEIKKFSDPQQFWCVVLNSALRPPNVREPFELDKIKARIKKLKETLEFDYVIANNTNQIVEDSGIVKDKNDWRLVVSTIFKAFRSSKSDFSLAELRTCGKILGPQLNFDHLDKSHGKDDLYLVWPDSSFKKPIFWVAINGKYLIFVFIDYESFYNKTGVRGYLNEYWKGDKDVNFVMFDEKDEPDAENVSLELINSLKEYRDIKRQNIETENYYVFPRYIRPDITLLGYINKNREQNTKSYIIFAFLLAFLIIYAAYFARYAWRVYIDKKPDKVSIKLKLRFLFFFANALPILVLLFIGLDYLAQKRADLLREKRDLGIEFIQDLDEKMELRYAKKLVQKEKAKTSLIKNISENNLTMPVMRTFYDDLGGFVNTTLLVASDSDIVASELAFVKGRKVLYEYKKIKEDDIKQGEVINKIGRYFLAKINNTRISEKDETEIELLLESVTRKSAYNVLYDLLSSRGKFLMFGFGQTVFLSVIDTFALDSTSDKQDYFFMGRYDSTDLQFDYLKEAIPQANRNDIGIKIVAFESSDYAIPPESYQNQDLRGFAQTLTSYPSKELKIVNYLGEPHLIIGFNGKHVSEFKLMGLFSLKEIDKIITKQRKQLIVFAVLSLLLTLTLSQILASSFIKPLFSITEAAMAISDNNFDYRLPNLGNDEFGAMGQIFNEVMVDLDELSVAGTIQTQLLPDNIYSAKNFSVYGKSISKSQLGGDYFDYLSVSNDNFGILLGDVAGHGVGAALIMAMAKAGIIQSENYWEKPRELVSRLHQLILESKTKKQKKIMTFQYLCLNSADGTGVYSNAGACSPIIVRKNENKTEELTLAGAALGAFKRATYDEKNIKFNPGDAIVFYTDGLVESRNEADIELGYDGMKKILLDSWDNSAEIYYNNIYKAYLGYIGSVSAGDDLTIIVAVFNPE